MEVVPPINWNVCVSYSPSVLDGELPAVDVVEELTVEAVEPVEADVAVVDVDDPLAGASETDVAVSVVEESPVTGVVGDESTVADVASSLDTANSASAAATASETRTSSPSLLMTAGAGATSSSSSTPTPLQATPMAVDVPISQSTTSPSDFISDSVTIPGPDVPESRPKRPLNNQPGTYRLSVCQ